MSEKTRLEDLAILGGTPAFAETLHVGRPNIGDRGMLFERINDLLDRRWLTNNGPYVQQLEQRVADLIGAKHCIAMCNATIALEIAIRALGLKGEVLIPSFTFVATAHSLQWQGITPVFCDIDPISHTIDPEQVERAITSRTSGIIGVHVWGRPCNVEALAEICARHGLKLLFDAAHAFCCTHRGRMIGSFGDAEVFSFHATKFFNTFEGGAIVTESDEVADKARLMRNFGFAGYDKVVQLGTNGKMNEVSAAMGLTSLESLDNFIAVNRRNYQRYREQLQNVPGVRFLNYDENEKCNYQYIVLEVDETVTRIKRDRLLQILWDENVMARRYFYPGCHLMEPYCSDPLYAAVKLPATEKLTRQILVLPTGTSVEEAHINVVCSIVRLAIAHGPELDARLQSAEASAVMRSAQGHVAITGDA